MSPKPTPFRLQGLPQFSLNPWLCPWRTVRRALLGRCQGKLSWIGRETTSLSATPTLENCVRTMVNRPVSGTPRRQQRSALEMTQGMHSTARCAAHRRKENREEKTIPGWCAWGVWQAQPARCLRARRLRNRCCAQYRLLHAEISLKPSFAPRRAADTVGVTLPRHRDWLTQTVDAPRGVEVRRRLTLRDAGAVAGAGRSALPVCRSGYSGTDQVRGHPWRQPTLPAFRDDRGLRPRRCDQDHRPGVTA